MARFGVEEEFVLLDDTSLVPLGIDDATRLVATTFPGPGQVTVEYLRSQLECVTAPVHTLADAAAQLRRMRETLGAQITGKRAVMAASGTPFATTRSLAVFPAPHYDDVAAHLGHLTRGHEVNGLHVHVEVAGEEERVRALNRLRGWMPALLALTGNSPFADGLDTGFASWRSIVIRRIPSSWTPPRFHDADDYRRHLDRLIDLGAIPVPASLSWSARISDRYPTVEARVFDAQLDVADTVFAAALTRAIAVTDDDHGSTAGVDELDASLWTAARYGRGARIIDPSSGDVSDAAHVVSRLLDAVGPTLDELGDLPFVDDHLARIRRDGTGAERQRRAFARDGIDGLRALYLDGTRALP